MPLCAAAPHRARSGPVDFGSSPRGSDRPRCRTLLGGLTEQNPASGVHDWLARRMPDCFADPGKDPNVKTRACFCVIFCGPVFSFSSERTPRDASGAAGVYARRFPLLPKRTGRRCGGSTMLATAPAKTEFCLFKGIPEPRPVAGISPEQDAFLSNSVMAGLVPAIHVSLVVILPR